MDTPSTKSVAERIEEAMREIGMLLLAFAPLDAVLAEPARTGRLLLFFCFGIFLFIAAVLLERRRARDV
jgi:C4-dicarboxylate-specific signal transduction histidine kinase